MTEMEKLRGQCLECTRCHLCETRTNVVFGVGPEDAKIMFIGEGPGENEDLQGEPFVGRAGKLLDDMLELIDLDRSKVYIANMVKCRPPKNRDPLPEEQNACAPWLSRQIELINPRVIVCLGRISAMRFIRPDFKITKEHGQWFEKDGRQVMAIYHPAALLRDPRKRRRPSTTSRRFSRPLPACEPGRISPERSVRIFRYSKISPDNYQYWVKIGKSRTAFLRKDPCGHSDIPKSLLVLPAA